MSSSRHLGIFPEETGRLDVSDEPVLAGRSWNHVESPVADQFRAEILVVHPRGQQDAGVVRYGGQPVHFAPPILLSSGPIVDRYRCPKLVQHLQTSFHRSGQPDFPATAARNPVNKQKEVVVFCNYQQSYQVPVFRVGQVTARRPKTGRQEAADKTEHSGDKPQSSSLKARCEYSFCLNFHKRRPEAGNDGYAGGMASTRVLIADDHPLVRGGLRSLLQRNGEFEVVAEASDGYEAIELATLHKPDVILLDVAMPRLNGTDAAQYIRDKAPRAGVVMISMHADESYILRALKSGARGYLLKASPESEVIAAVRAVASGEAYFSPVITRILVEEYVSEMQRRGVDDSYDLLTLREKEILQLLVSGRGNKDIADQLNVSVATVETHRNNIFQKLHVHNLPELILYAVRKGIVT